MRPEPEHAGKYLIKVKFMSLLNETAKSIILKRLSRLNLGVNSNEKMQSY
jgi:hypothetical protein